MTAAPPASCQAAMNKAMFAMVPAMRMRADNRASRSSMLSAKVRASPPYLDARVSELDQQDERDQLKPAVKTLPHTLA
jgi:hypothetical protein